MKTLILNGSPRRAGDTAALVSLLKAQLRGEVVEISAYYDGISACIDCRYCWSKKGCSIRDGMDAVYADDYDAVVIASPVYFSNLPGPLMGLASRFQMYYAARRFLKSPIEVRRKKGALLLVGGGEGKTDCAMEMARWMFRYMNAEYREEDAVLSLKTDVLPAGEDADAIAQVEKIARWLNGVE